MAGSMSHLATNLDKILDLHENNERGEYGKGQECSLTIEFCRSTEFMCGLTLFTRSGTLVENALTIPRGDTVLGIGELLVSDGDATIEVATLRNNGLGDLEIVSERVVKGNLSEILSALRELGFSFVEGRCRIMMTFLELLSAR